MGPREMWKRRGTTQSCGWKMQVYLSSWLKSSRPIVWSLSKPAEPCSQDIWAKTIDHNRKIMHDAIYLLYFPPSYLIWKWLEIPPTLFSLSWALVIQFIKWQRKKWSWHLCIDLFVSSTQTTSFLFIHLCISLRDA